MVMEHVVRRLLDLSEQDRLEERGVFPPPAMQGMARPPSDAALEPSELLLGEEWLDDEEMAGHFTEEPRIAAGLPRGRVKRLLVEPRILVFEGTPVPRVLRGRVVHNRADTWVQDARDGPALLVFPADHHEVVVFSQKGDVRLFVLRRAPGAG
jgi:hypothetical protein